jgi:Tfp pilus assembly protein PilO
VNSLVSRIKSSRRASAVAVALLIVLVAAAAWVAVVSPKRANVTKLKGQVVAAQAQLATATQAANVANKAAEAAALRAMPADPDQPGILDQLNSLGKRTGVLVATVTPNMTAVTPNTVGLSVTVDGKYFQIANFLNKLRTQVRVGSGGRVVSSGRLFDVQSVNIAQGNATGQLAATITVNASVYDAAAPVAPTTASTSATASAPTGSTG